MGNRSLDYIYNTLYRIYDDDAIKFCDMWNERNPEELWGIIEFDIYVHSKFNPKNCNDQLNSWCIYRFKYPLECAIDEGATDYTVKNPGLNPSEEVNKFLWALRKSDYYYNQPLPEEMFVDFTESLGLTPDPRTFEFKMSPTRTRFNIVSLCNDWPQFQFRTFGYN